MGADLCTTGFSRIILSKSVHTFVFGLLHPMAEEKAISQETFKLLLTWLDADESTAAEKYERIRQRLIRIFVGRGCHEADALADQTIDRVTIKVPQIAAGYVGDPAVYFYGVAHKIHLEWLRKQKIAHEGPAVIETPAESGDEKDIEYDCLESCLAELSPDAREMILEYYRDEKKAKIERRRNLAIKLGITIGALQIKASRIRTRLLECVTKCVAERSELKAF